VHLCLDALQELCDGQLYKLRLQKLLCGNALLQFLLQLLFLYLILCHLAIICFQFFGKGCQFLRIVIAEALPDCLTRLKQRA